MLNRNSKNFDVAQSGRQVPTRLGVMTRKISKERSLCEKQKERKEAWFPNVAAP